MAIVINGSGTVTGLAVGGLPDGTVDDGTVASGIASSKLTGALPAISGASLTGVGKVLQVVSTTKLDTFSVSGTGIIAVTGFSLAITPSSTSNKIFITATFCGRQGDYGGGWLLYRGSSSVATPSSIGNRQGIHSSAWFGEAAATENYSLSYLDSPSSTSALTYQIYVNARSNTIYHLNRSSDDANSADRPRTISTITAMEIEG
jgi:hypothetical protein